MLLTQSSTVSNKQMTTIYIEQITLLVGLEIFRQLLFVSISLLCGYSARACVTIELLFCYALSWSASLKSYNDIIQAFMK